MKRGEFRSDEIWVIHDVTESVLGRNCELAGGVESRIEKRSLSVHFVLATNAFQ